MRLEDFLCGRFRRLSKMYLRETVRDERCEVNGRFENIGYRLRVNDFIEIELDPTREASMIPQDIPLDVVYEDTDLIVVNKPAGMLVHPSHREKTGTLLNALTFYLNREGETRRKGKGENLQESEAVSSSPGLLFSPASFVRPGLIHRLDRETSGLVVVAKNARAHRILAGHFGRGSRAENADGTRTSVRNGVRTEVRVPHAKLVEKRYLALVEGVVEADEGAIAGEIGRYAEEKRWGLKADGKRAETLFWVRERNADSTLLELEPVTGRTNQLRIHCASIGHSITGDTSRGGRKFHRLCLHAWKLSFRHPTGGRLMEFEAPISFRV